VLKCINIAVEVLPEVYVDTVGLFRSCMQRYVGSCFIKIFIFFGFVYPVNISELKSVKVSQVSSYTRSKHLWVLKWDWCLSYYPQ